MADDRFAQVRDQFSGDQLRAARDLRRLTQAELASQAAKVGQGASLTGAAVSQFELGDAVPSVATLQALSLALDVDPMFLVDRPEDREVELPAFFRSLRAAPARERKHARIIVQLIHRLAAVLDEHIGLPDRQLPECPCDPFDQEDRRLDAEDAAAEVRSAWGLGPGPVPNVVSALETHGVICARLGIVENRIDAFSVNFAAHPVVVLSTEKDKWDRSRFDAAHELGHLVMHDGAAGVPEAEKQAHEFAAAFLMPAQDIADQLPARADWPRYLALKGQWGVSLGALLMRARTLEVMSERTYVSAQKTLSARGWRRHEPGDGEIEQAQLLSEALQRARKRRIRIDRLRDEAAIPSDVLHELLQSI